MLLALAGCAASVAYAPIEITAAVAESRQIVVLNNPVQIQLDTGYSRTLKADSQWIKVGAVKHGDVYKPFNSVFTLEGENIHEAWLVVSSDRLKGFYLPVERGFSPLNQAISVRFSSTN